MPRPEGAGLAPVVVLLCAAGLCGQGDIPEDRPAVHVPVRPPNRRDRDRRQAQTLFGVAALQEHRNQLVEAVRTYEAVVRLDPDAAEPLRRLVPLYIALERTDDALAGCRRVLELDPDDGETAFLYARQLRRRGDNREARAVLSRAADRPALDRRPELKARVCGELAVLSEEAEDWDTAEKNYRRVAAVLDHPEPLLEQGFGTRAEIDAQAAETWERLGRVCLQAGKTEQALEAMRQANRLEPARAARLGFHLAEALARQGRAAEALVRVEEYLRSRPEGTEGYELQVRLLRQLGRDADVLPALEAAAQRDSHNAALGLLLARECTRAELPDRAKTVYQRLIAESPTVDAYRGLLDLYRDRPDHILALLDAKVKAATDEKAGDARPRPGEVSPGAHARAMLGVLRQDADLVRRLLPAAQDRLRKRVGLGYGTRVLLANLAGRTGQLGDAEALYRACLDTTRDNEHEVYQGLLTVLQRAHKYEDMVQLCQGGLRHAEATNRVLFHLHLAEAYAALGRDRQALAAADAAVADAGEKERLRCRLERAQLLTGAGRHADAAAECRALLREYNQAGDVRAIRSVLSAVHSAAHDYVRAEEQLRLILQTDSADATANNDLGYLWADQNKNLAEAERLIRKALDLDREQRRGGAALGLEGEEDNAAFVDSLGWVLFRRGRLQDACRELERAAALPGGDDDPVVWDHLGDVCQRLGRTDRATVAWKKALQLYELGVRSRNDGRYDDIKQKLSLTRGK
jgi:tetratricopeptide (TPR) repeat protein